LASAAAKVSAAAWAASFTFDMRGNPLAAVEDFDRARGAGFAERFDTLDLK
jgi:hypothetical protein